MEEQLEVGMEEELEKESRPFRFLFKLTVFAALIYFAGRFMYQKKDEYYGLTESEARGKIKDKLEPRIGQEKADEVANQVVPLLKDRGVVKGDPVSEAASDLADTMADAEDSMKGAVDSMSDAVEDAVDDGKAKGSDAVDSVKKSVDKAVAD